MKTTLLVPTLNEIDGMREVMPKVKTEWVDQILIVDGQSTDGTAEYARSRGYDVVVQKKKGLRFAYIEGLEQAVGDVIITFSPDGNSDPERIPALVGKMKEGYDMVIVSRYTGGAKSYDDDFITGPANWIYTSLLNFLFKSNYTDACVMFRAWKKGLFYAFELDKDKTYAFEEKILFTTMGCEQLFSIRCAKAKLKCADIPGDEPRRLGGQRKLQLFRWGTGMLYETFRDYLFWKYEKGS
ncbi:MAG: glycosyltransferase family 2 protein [Candidatus Vogelbacteria bacterium]|nr:glycosyltransferase family 2 protein [Candidatus Vogelbacteria bacterium]